MAITQISKITHRKGFQSDLPELDNGEIGWAYDTRRLFIGNSNEPAWQANPARWIQGQNVTEILTTESNLLELANTYRYLGVAAGYEHDTVLRSLTDKIDERVSVKDYGAVGNGITDDTDAIRAAIADLFLKTDYTATDSIQSRRVLFFPAGEYVISDQIQIPSYATLRGEGKHHSIIRFEDTSTVFGSRVVVFAPGTTHTVVSSMGFTSTNPVTLVALESIESAVFYDVGFYGSSSADEDMILMRVESLGPTTTNEKVLIRECEFQNAYRGIETAGPSVAKQFTVSNSEFSNCNSAIVGGFVFSHFGVNRFTSIISTAVDLAVESEFNTTQFNSFVDVANNPALPQLSFRGQNNVSVGDMYSRPNTVDLHSRPSIAISNGEKIHIGSYTRETGNTVELELYTVDTEWLRVPLAEYRSFRIDFSVERVAAGGTASRTGFVKVSAAYDGTLHWDEEYVENLSADIEFKVFSPPESDEVSITYTLLSNPPVAVNGGILTYSITKL
jgi:hypothetical protein